MNIIMNTINRRTFLRSAGTLAASAALPVSCSTKKAPAEEPQGEKTMEYRTNAANGDKVSLLGYGCMRWPLKKDENGEEIIDQDKVNALVDYALEHGVNYFDTSPAYLKGQSEKATGIALSRHPRDSYYLATKLSNFSNASDEASLAMYRDSFVQMQTDHFDYYLLHSIGRGGLKAFNKRYVDNGMLDFLLGERESGRIRNLGFSFHGSQKEFDELLALHDKYHWDFIQIQMNYVDWRHADGVRNVNAEYLYEQIDAREIPIVIMEPLQGGRLSDVPNGVAQRLKEREPQRSIASWAFRFVGSYPRVLTALSGMTYMEHLQDNLDTFLGFKPLSEEDKDFLMKTADIISDYPTVNCNDCKYCMPCPYGIDIPGVFKHYNSCVNEGLVASSGAQSDYKKLRRAYLTSYNKSVESLRQADHCIGCGTCLEHCPQSIDIPHELHRIDKYIEKLKQNTL